MKLSWQKLFAVLLLLFFFAACTHKAKDTVQPIPATSCDTVNLNYSSAIQPIFRTHCYSCHGDSSTSANTGLNLEDTAKLRAYLANGFRGDGIYGSKLYHCMLHSPLAQQMPPTYVVDSCSLKKVRCWLAVGAPF